MDLLQILEVAVVLALLLAATFDSIQRSTECVIAIRLTDDATGGPADEERRPLAAASLEVERRPEADVLVVAALYRGAMGMDGNGGAAV